MCSYVRIIWNGQNLNSSLNGVHPLCRRGHVESALLRDDECGVLFRWGVRQSPKKKRTLQPMLNGIWRWRSTLRLWAKYEAFLILSSGLGTDNGGAYADRGRRLILVAPFDQLGALESSCTGLSPNHTDRLASCED